MKSEAGQKSFKLTSSQQEQEIILNGLVVKTAGFETEVHQSKSWQDNLKVIQNKSHKIALGGVNRLSPEKLQTQSHYK